MRSMALMATKVCIFIHLRRRQQQMVMVGKRQETKAAGEQGSSSRKARRLQLPTEKHMAAYLESSSFKRWRFGYSFLTECASERGQ